jgi:hypothetical protein
MTDFKLHHFVLREEGLKLVEMPEKPVQLKANRFCEYRQYNEAVTANLNAYNEALESAIESSVLVSNQEEVREALENSMYEGDTSLVALKEGEIYSLECAVEVKSSERDLAQCVCPECGAESYYNTKSIAHVTFPQTKEDQSIHENLGTTAKMFEVKAGEYADFLTFLTDKVLGADLLDKMMIDFEKWRNGYSEDQPGEADKVEENRAQLSVWHEVEQLVCRPAGFLIHPEVLELLMKSYHITRKNYEG